MDTKELTWSFGIVRQLVKLEVALHGHVPRQVTELHLDQLLGVDGPVPVSAGSHWLGQNHSSRVDGLGHLYCDEY